MVRYHIILSGLVQEVGFRFFVYHTAIELNLAGWIRNCYDGSVEIEAQGDRKAMDEFMGKLVRGNGFSTVEDFTYKNIDIKENEKAFRITY